MRYSLAAATIIINICVSHYFSSTHTARLQSQVTELASVSLDCAKRTKSLESHFHDNFIDNYEKLENLEIKISVLENSRDEIEKEAAADREDINTIVKILRHRGVK